MTSDTYGLTAPVYSAGQLLLVGLVVISALCIGFTVYGALTTARGRSQPW